MKITVKDLLKACREQVAKGNGDKIIYLSNDDEGNGYHQMFFLFSEEVSELDVWDEIKDPENKIILG